MGLVWHHLFVGIAVAETHVNFIFPVWSVFFRCSVSCCVCPLLTFSSMSSTYHFHKIIIHCAGAVHSLYFNYLSLSLTHTKALIPVLFSLSSPSPNSLVHMETLRIALSPDGPDNTVLMPALHWPVLPCVCVCMLQNERVSDRSSACTSVCAILTRKQQVVVDVHIHVLQELKSPWGMLCYW